MASEETQAETMLNVDVYSGDNIRRAQNSKVKIKKKNTHTHTHNVFSAVTKKNQPQAMFSYEVIPYIR